MPIKLVRPTQLGDPQNELKAPRLVQVERISQMGQPIWLTPPRSHVAINK